MTENLGGDPLEQTTSTGIALKGIQQQYLLNLMDALSKMDTSIAAMSGSTDFRPVLMGRQVILRVPEESIRKAILSALDEELTRISKDVLDNEKKSRSSIIAVQNAVAQVVTYMDSYLAIHSEHVLGDV